MVEEYDLVTGEVINPNTPEDVPVVKAPPKNPTPPKRKRGRPTAGKESKRMRLFKLLAGHPEGLDNVKIRQALKTEAIAAMCRDETVYGRLKLVYNPESRGKMFTLSAKGRKAMKDGTVDTKKAPEGRWDD